MITTTEPTPFVIELNSQNMTLRSNSAYISWSPSRIMGVIYSLIIKSGGNTPFSASFDLYQPYHVFTAPEGAPSCEVYNFSVTVTYVGATYTGDGCSVPSPVLSTMLPSLPNIERMNASLML